MKKNPFKKNSVITTAVSVLGAGAGSAVTDWLLERYNIIDKDSWGESTVNAVKLVAGAAAGAMIPANSGMFYMIAKSACDGIATVAAHNLVADMLPATEEPAPKGNKDGTAGLPYGTIGATHRRLGQRTWRKVDGVGNASFMGA